MAQLKQPFHDNQGTSLRATKDIDNLVLVANTAKTYTVPADVTHLSMACTADFLAKYNFDDDTDVATIPSADIIDGTGMDINPTVRYLYEVDVSKVTSISFISASNCIMSITKLKNGK